VSASVHRPPGAAQLLLRMATVVVLVFLIAPIVVVFPLSFSSGELLTLPTPGYSWRWYEDFFTSGKWLVATKNSFIVGIATAVLATFLGTLGALGIFLGNFRGKAVLVAALSLPMVVPVVVTAIAVYFAFSLVGLNNTLAGLILAHTVLSVPYVLITARRRTSPSVASCCRSLLRVWRPAPSSRSLPRSTSWSSRSSWRAPASSRCRARCMPACASS
jgi:putative spermidine/putrescine transport system permease protein